MGVESGLLLRWIRLMQSASLGNRRFRKSAFKPHGYELRACILTGAGESRLESEAAQATRRTRKRSRIRERPNASSRCRRPSGIGGGDPAVQLRPESFRRVTSTIVVRDHRSRAAPTPNCSYIDDLSEEEILAFMTEHGRVKGLAAQATATPTLPLVCVHVNVHVNA